MKMRKSIELIKTDGSWIRKKIDVNISKDVWKKWGVHKFHDQYWQGRVTKMLIFIKISLVFMGTHFSEAPTGTESHEGR